MRKLALRHSPEVIQKQMDALHAEVARLKAALHDERAEVVHLRERIDTLSNDVVIERTKAQGAASRAAALARRAEALEGALRQCQQAVEPSQWVLACREVKGIVSAALSAPAAEGTIKCSACGKVRENPVHHGLPSATTEAHAFVAPAAAPEGRNL